MPVWKKVLIGAVTSVLASILFAILKVGWVYLVALMSQPHPLMLATTHWSSLIL